MATGVKLKVLLVVLVVAVIQPALAMVASSVVRPVIGSPTAVAAWLRVRGSPQPSHPQQRRRLLSSCLASGDNQDQTCEGVDGSGTLKRLIHHQHRRPLPAYPPPLAAATDSPSTKYPLHQSQDGLHQENGQDAPSFLADMKAYPRLASFLIYGSFTRAAAQTYIDLVSSSGHRGDEASVAMALHDNTNDDIADSLGDSTRTSPHTTDTDPLSMFIPLALENAPEFRLFLEQHEHSILNGSLVHNYVAKLIGRAHTLESHQSLQEHVDIARKRYLFDHLEFDSRDIQVMTTLHTMLEQYITYLWNLRDVNGHQFSPTTQKYVQASMTAFSSTLQRLKAFFYFFHTPSFQKLTRSPVFLRGTLLSESFVADVLEVDDLPSSSAKSIQDIHDSLTQLPELWNALIRLDFVRRALIDYILPGQLGEAFLFNDGCSTVMNLLAPSSVSSFSSSRRKRLTFLIVLEELLDNAENQSAPEDKSKSSATALSTKWPMFYSLMALMDYQKQMVLDTLRAVKMPSTTIPPSQSSNIFSDLSLEVYRYLFDIRLEVADLLTILAPVPAEPDVAGKDARNRDAIYFADWYFSAVTDIDILIKSD